MGTFAYEAIDTPLAAYAACITNILDCAIIVIIRTSDVITPDIVFRFIRILQEKGKT
jgi:hypothetical protein